LKTNTFTTIFSSKVKYFIVTKLPALVILTNQILLRVQYVRLDTLQGTEYDRTTFMRRKFVTLPYTPLPLSFHSYIHISNLFLPKRHT